MYLFVWFPVFFFFSCVCYKNSSYSLSTQKHNNTSNITTTLDVAENYICTDGGCITACKTKWKLKQRLETKGKKVCCWRFQIWLTHCVHSFITQKFYTIHSFALYSYLSILQILFIYDRMNMVMIEYCSSNAHSFIHSSSHIWVLLYQQFIHS